MFVSFRLKRTYHRGADSSVVRCCRVGAFERKHWVHILTASTTHRRAVDCRSLYKESQRCARCCCAQFVTVCSQKLVAIVFLSLLFLYRKTFCLTSSVRLFCVKIFSPSHVATSLTQADSTKLIIICSPIFCIEFHGDHSAAKPFCASASTLASAGARVGQSFDEAVTGRDAVRVTIYVVFARARALSGWIMCRYCTRISSASPR